MAIQILSFPSRESRTTNYMPEILIVCAAVVLRLWALEAKPPHFDEGVNGWFADQMNVWGYYRYDPTNYHGPFYFYLIYLFKTLFGRELWALRMPAVIASILSVILMFRFSEFFGRKSVRLAALAMAVSPACVFYGRYSIHESWLVLFSMGFIWGILGLWKNGTSKYLYTIFLSFSGMIITKETWIISLTVVALAFCILILWQRIIISEPDIPWAHRQWGIWNLFVGILIVVLAVVIFYSGFFHNFLGVRKFFTAFSAWSNTGFGETSGHEKQDFQIGFFNYYWLYLIARYEWPALLGLVACIPLIGKSSGMRRFLALFAVGLLCAYSIIPYKTPWLIITLLWPFFLLFGGGARDLVNMNWVSSRFQKICLGLLISLPIAVAFSLCIQLNFFHATDEKEPYVYVQTYPEIHVFTDPLLTLAKRDARNYHLRGAVLLESYYPIPWILGDFSYIGYYNKAELWPKTIDGDFMVVLESNAAKAEERMHEAYYKRRFRLRNGMHECVAYFRATPFAQLFGGSPEFQPKTSSTPAQ